MHNSNAGVVPHHDFSTGKEGALGMVSVGNKERGAEMDVTVPNPTSAEASWPQDIFHPQGKQHSLPR